MKRVLIRTFPLGCHGQGFRWFIFFRRLGRSVFGLAAVAGFEWANAGKIWRFPKIGGYPKWMVYKFFIMEIPINMFFFLVVSLKSGNLHMETKTTKNVPNCPMILSLLGFSDFLTSRAAP